MENDNSSDGLLGQIEELNKALNAGKTSTPFVAGSSMLVDDQTDSAAQYLTESAKADLANRAKTLSVKKDDGTFAICIYFTVRTRTDNKELGIKQLAKVANELSQEGLIHSTLSPISSLELARMPLQLDTSVVFMFVLVPSDKAQEIKARYKDLSVEEGEMGKDIDDLNPKLADGEFLAEIRVSPTASLLSSAKTSDVLLQQNINDYLKVLPPGTKVVQITQCAITDLSIPYEVKFYNALLQRVKSVELEYVREFARIGDTIEQFNLLTGVRYFDAERKSLYGYGK